MNNSVKVQIYLGAATLHDVLSCVDAGANFIGMVADQKLIGNQEMGGHVLPTLDEVRDIFSALPMHVMTVALTFDHDIDRIVTAVDRVRPKVVHLAGNKRLSHAQLLELRLRIPTVKIMFAIPMNLPNALADALSYQYYCDFFLLDSKGDEIEHPYGVGATGNCHDWSLSAELVRQVGIPVILAGGLSAENVSEAIKIVQPWGVDSFTLTNITPDRESRKDIDKVKAFIHCSRG